MLFGESLAHYIMSYVPRVGTPGALIFESSAETLLRRNINTQATLFREYSNLSDGERFIVLCYFLKNPKCRLVPLLFREIRRSPSGSAPGVASAVLATIGGDDLMRRLLRELRRAENNTVKRRLSSALAHIRNVDDAEGYASNLLSILSDKSQLDGCRADAAEGLQNALISVDRRKRLYRSCIKALESALEHTNKWVRESAKFSLRKLATPPGRRLVTL